MDKLKQELNRIEDLVVIKKRDKSIGWVHPLLIVAKPVGGSFRICDLAIQKEQYQIPTADQTATKLAGVIYFANFEVVSLAVSSNIYL